MQIVHVLIPEILCLSHNLLFTLQRITWHILPLIPFPTISNISLSVNNFSSTYVFFKCAFHDNAAGEWKWAGSSSCILIQFPKKLSNASASNMTSLWAYRWWYSPWLLCQNLFSLFLNAFVICICGVFHFEFNLEFVFPGNDVSLNLTNHVLIWKSSFLQHQALLINIVITKFVCAHRYFF